MTAPLNKPYLTDVYLTDSTRTFISGPRLYPIFIFETVWNKVPYLRSQKREAFAAKVYRICFYSFQCQLALKIIVCDVKRKQFFEYFW